MSEAIDPTELLPHAPPMLMVTDVIAHDEKTIHCRCHIAADNPLLVDGLLPAHCGIELLAQGSGLLLGLQHRQGKPGGAIAAVRSFNVNPKAVASGDVIDVHSRFIGGTQDAALFEGEARLGEHDWCSASIMLVTTAEAQS